ncbi:MAG: hypothetical protein HYX87_00105 [Chloroflexi bacterium]|nr:hypothetical protein [Chloroflexota bacterium]
MTLQEQKHLKHIRNICYWIYIVMFVAGRTAMMQQDRALVAWEWSVVIGLTAVQVAIGLYGSYNWMRAKSRNTWLTSIGILGPIGWLILIFFKEKTVIVEVPDKSGPAMQVQMRKATLVFMSLALGATVFYGVAITVNASNTAQTLAVAQSELSAAKTELKSVQGAHASMQDALSSAERTLASTRSDFTSASQRLSSTQNELLATKNKLNDMDAKLKLYEDTMGIRIFSGVQPRARGAGPIELVNNPVAVDPTWQQLVAFLRADTTNARTWTEGVFVSGDFAEMLHNNAEAAGIRAALAGVYFEGKVIGHGFNAFKTADRGLVYVEPQSDAIAYVTKGKEYGTVGLSHDLRFDYGYYERVKADWNSYIQQLEAFNRDVQAFNREISGKVYYIGTREWFRVKEWKSDLAAKEKALVDLRAQLEQVREPMGIVKTIEIYW